MPHERFKWIDRLKFLEREHRVVATAIESFRRAILSYFQRIRNSYIDDDLYRRYSIVDEPTGPSICRSFRPHSTWNRGASGSRRGIRIRLGRPLLVDATDDFFAPEGAGIGGADFAQSSGAIAALQAGDGAIESGHGLAGESARDLGRHLQATRRVTRRVEASTERGAKEMKPAEVSATSDPEVLVKRSFDAPVNLVWQAYTDPALMR